jgi:hypothetical protein
LSIDFKNEFNLQKEKNLNLIKEINNIKKEFNTEKVQSIDLKGEINELK